MSGRIEDKTSGEDLISATVLAMENGLGSVSNVYGFFSITLPAGPTTLQFSYVGYKAQEIEINLRSDTSLQKTIMPYAFIVRKIMWIEKHIQ